MDLPTLDHLVDEPTLAIEVEGRAYRFRELTIQALARLQAWIKAKVPHPLDDVRPRLAGLPPKLQERLVELAYEDGRRWPPRIGTLEGFAVLTGNVEGQAAVLHEGLRAADPAATAEDAGRLLQALMREAQRRAAAKLPDDLKVARIFACLFGTPDPTKRGPAGPKAGAAPEGGDATSPS